MSRRARRGHAWLRASVLSAFGAFACAQVLGIEDAHEDPTLSSGGNSAASSSSSGGEGGGATPKGGAGSSGASSGGTGATSGGSASGGVLSGGFDAGGEAGSAGSSGAGGGSSGEGGGAGSGDGGASGAAGAGGGTGGPSLCEQYCDTVTELCTSAALQYKDRTQCLKVCALLPEGAVGDPDGNTVACRLKYASKGRYAAGSELVTYCRQAGPGGEGRCGNNCDGFCSITMATCSKAETDPFYFATEAECQSTCQGLPNIPYVYGDVSVADGNSVQCRLFHAISAVMADAGEHCEHVMGLTLCEAPQ